jgi:hypothetical protein
MSGFAILLELSRNPLELDAEFPAESNGTISRGCCRRKKPWGQSQAFPGDLPNIHCPDTLYYLSYI